MASSRQILRQDAGPARADSTELARSAGRAVALVAALRRLRRRSAARAGGPVTDRPTEKG